MASQRQPSKEAGGSDKNSSKTMVRLGIDLGKSSIHLWGVDAQDERVVKKQVRRSALVREVAKLPACLIGLEACGGAHHWAREISRHNHAVRLMAPQIVKGSRATRMRQGCGGHLRSGGPGQHTLCSSQDAPDFAPVE